MHMCNFLLELGGLIFKTQMNGDSHPAFFYNSCLMFITAFIVSQTTS